MLHCFSLSDSKGLNNNLKIHTYKPTIKISYSISGVPFTFNKEGHSLTLFTTGEIGTSVAWAVDETGAPLVPPGQAANINVVE